MGGTGVDDKPLARAARLITERSTAFCTILLLAGSLGLLGVPLAARKAYFDENALLPGVSHLAVTRGGEAAQQAAEAFMRRAWVALEGGNRTAGGWQGWLAEEMAGLGLPSQVYEGPDGCFTSVGTLQPPRGDNKEALVLATPAWAEGGGAAGAMALAAGYQLLSALKGVAWLAKNIIWLAPEGSCGVAGNTAVASWLASYYGLPQPSNRLRRAGRIQQALVIEVSPSGGGKLSSFEVLMQGPWGELPNLDLVHLAAWSARRYTSLPVNLPSTLKGAERLLAPAAQVYAQQLAGMAGFLGLQLSGRSTGAHSPFRSYGADAVTLRAVLTPSPHPAQALSGARAVSRLAEASESVLHSCSNLLEALHHSYNQYVLLGPEHFVTPEVYLAPAGLLLLSLGIKAAAVQADDGRSPPSPWWAAIASTVAVHFLSWAAAACASIPQPAELAARLLRDTSDILGIEAAALAVPPELLGGTVAAAAAVAGMILCVSLCSSSSWRKTKVAMLTLLTAESAAAGCCNWVVAWTVLVAIAPSALLCCPWRRGAPSCRGPSALHRFSAAVAALGAPAVMALAAFWASTRDGEWEDGWRESLSGLVFMGSVLFLPSWCSVVGVGIATP